MDRRRNGFNTNGSIKLPQAGEGATRIKYISLKRSKKMKSIIIIMLWQFHYFPVTIKEQQTSLLTWGKSDSI